MAQPYVGEIRMFAGNFAPAGWMFCDGQLLPISQNTALFSLLGTTYGGNGQTNFALPDLRARMPIHVGSGFTQGEAGGETAHTLTIQELPQHFHTASAATADADAPVALGNMIGAFNNGYRAAASLQAITASTVTNVGGSQPHENMSPYLTISFCIALQGIFPSPN